MATMPSSPNMTLETPTERPSSVRPVMVAASAEARSKRVFDAIDACAERNDAVLRDLAKR